jgi:hypothetical protein
MKATLTHSIPEELEAHMDAIKGSEYKARLQEIDNRCRSVLKHGNPSEETERVMLGIRALCGNDLWE